MSDINKLMDLGFSQTIARALCDQGINSIEKLCSFTLDDLEVLDGIGPKALLKIAKIKEAMTNSTKYAADQMKPTKEPTVEKYMTKEPPKELATVTTKTYSIELQFRHAEWVKMAAEAYGMSEAQVIQQAIRKAYANDPYKAGKTEFSGSVLKHDNPYS